MKTIRSHPPQAEGVRSTRDRLLAALFAEAKKKNIDAEFLRDVIAKNIIGKRLSEASPQELMKVLEHVTGKHGRNCQEETPDSTKGVKKYESSRKGLIEELKDIAEERYGNDFEMPLNNLCKQFGVLRYQWLDMRHLKAVKAALIRLQEKGEYERPAE